MGTAGIQEISNEQALLGAMQAALGQTSGLYMFPAMGAGQTMEAYEKKLATSPQGLLIYHPPGGSAMTAGQLATEFLKELVMAALAILLLVRARVCFTAVVGLTAAAMLKSGVTT